MPRASCVPPTPATPRNRLARESRIAEELETLSRAVRRIGCSLHSDPETIAIQKDEIAHRLALLAREVGR